MRLYYPRASKGSTSHFPYACITLELIKALRVTSVIRFEKILNFMKNIDFLEHAPDLSLMRIFSKTHRQTCQLHSWASIELIEVGKLLRSERNSWILSNLHVSDPFTPIFD